jgi:hypothetical protein
MPRKFILMIGIITSIHLNAQDTSYPNLLAYYARVNNSIQKLDSQYTRESEKNTSYLLLIKDLESIRKTVSTYVIRKDSVHRRPENLGDTLYLLELNNYARLLDSVSRLKMIGEAKKLLTFIDDDVYLKTDVLRNADYPDEDKVLVKVRVLNTSGTELPGYDVFVKPEISLDPRLVETFNPTNNATRKIQPGRKLFWIEKNGIRLKERKEGISITAETIVVIDFITNP